MNPTRQPSWMVFAWLLFLTTSATSQAPTGIDAKAMTGVWATELFQEGKRVLIFQELLPDGTARLARFLESGLRLLLETGRWQVEGEFVVLELDSPREVRVRPMMLSRDAYLAEIANAPAGEPVPKLVRVAAMPALREVRDPRLEGEWNTAIPLPSGTTAELRIVLHRDGTFRQTTDGLVRDEGRWQGIGGILLQLRPGGQSLLRYQWHDQHRLWLEDASGRKHCFVRKGSGSNACPSPPTLPPDLLPGLQLLTSAVQRNDAPRFVTMARDWLAAAVPRAGVEPAAIRWIMQVLLGQLMEGPGGIERASAQVSEWRRRAAERSPVDEAWVLVAGVPALQQAGELDAAMRGIREALRLGGSTSPALTAQATTILARLSTYASVQGDQEAAWSTAANAILAHDGVDSPDLLEPLQGLIWARGPAATTQATLDTMERALDLATLTHGPHSHLERKLLATTINALGGSFRASPDLLEILLGLAHRRVDSARLALWPGDLAVAQCLEELADTLDRAGSHDSVAALDKLRQELKESRFRDHDALALLDFRKSMHKVLQLSLADPASIRSPGFLETPLAKSLAEQLNAVARASRGQVSQECATLFTSIWQACGFPEEAISTHLLPIVDAAVTCEFQLTVLGDVDENPDPRLTALYPSSWRLGLDCIERHQGVREAERAAFAWVANFKGAASRRAAEAVQLQHLWRRGGEAAAAVNAHASARHQFGAAASSVHGLVEALLADELGAALYERVRLTYEDLARVGYRRGVPFAWVGGDELRKELIEGERHVEWIVHWPADQSTRARKPTERRHLDPVLYAWVVTPAGEDPIRLVRYGPYAPIKEAIDAAQGAGWTDESLERLYDLLWAPLEIPPDTQGVVLSPDDALWTVPWAALRRESSHLVQRHPIRLLPSAVDLYLSPPTQAPSAAVVFADADYSLAEPVQGARAFQPLRSSADEGKLAAASLGRNGDHVTLWVGKEASRARLLSVRSPRHLVVATHGIQLEDREPAFSGPLFGSRGIDPEPSPTPTPTLHSVLSSPRRSAMERCALVLAASPSPDAQRDPRLVTGRDILDMDLTGTELVVLSACRSALGDVAAGQGIVGLREAFYRAGAHSIVAAIRSVPDDATARLMARFYEHYAATGLADIALQQAQLDYLEEHRDAPATEWAAFQVLGNP
ncbi:MAG: CHAT domain-containing protein [Planctomycetota bacterium]